MYSVLLLAALTATPTTQAWNRGGCHGARGCHGSSGCHGSYGCHGTRGYAAYNGHSGYGSGCFGCYGYGANGSHGGWGGFYGHSGYGHGGGVLVCHGCYGAYGGYSGYGMPTHSSFMESAPPASNTAPFSPDRDPGKFEQTPPPKEKKGAEEQARIIIDVPADAMLYIDGNLMRTPSARRAFQTPSLPAGQIFYYELRAEVVRNGQVMTENQRVLVQAGQDARASFATLGQTAQSARSSE